MSTYSQNLACFKLQILKTFLHWLQVVISNMILDHVTKMPIQYSYKRTNGISEITEIPPPPRIEKTNQRLHYTHQHHTPIILFASVHQHSWFMTFCDLKNLTFFFFSLQTKRIIHLQTRTFHSFLVQHPNLVWQQVFKILLQQTKKIIHLQTRAFYSFLLQHGYFSLPGCTPWHWLYPRFLLIKWTNTILNPQFLNLQYKYMGFLHNHLCSMTIAKDHVPPFIFANNHICLL